MHAPPLLRGPSQSALLLKQSLQALDLSEWDGRWLAGDLKVFELAGSNPVVDAHSGHAKEIRGHRLVHEAVRGYAPLIPLPFDATADRDPTEQAGWVPLDLDSVLWLVVAHLYKM